jgi:hypothetical protein
LVERAVQIVDQKDDGYLAEQVTQLSPARRIPRTVIARLEQVLEYIVELSAGPVQEDRMLAALVQDMREAPQQRALADSRWPADLNRLAGRDHQFERGQFLLASDWLITLRRQLGKPPPRHRRGRMARRHRRAILSAHCDQLITNK